MHYDVHLKASLDPHNSLSALRIFIPLAKEMFRSCRARCNLTSLEDCLYCIYLMLFTSNTVIHGCMPYKYREIGIKEKHRCQNSWIMVFALMFFKDFVAKHTHPNPTPETAGC